ncbi:cAMP-binding proteins - catabolite gene activator and regulatory subunit of cAMP-dependent protein kinases [Georgfuchsia toluolica]|uniref:cAMP-binding proteins - catabolite gene activator and regulatory subunit of cAMP-dependent protein kinases n=1 Tax=Georgfuchsia toluolica TaxID=424218 RepID=A0A916NIY9_9PROT|nr:Crp/Fnr family transcriptional regulator [Georgfuchsia toluolica]CAG4885103.1 cAMP-binding proteins - catabolite gene activator and regulatory subunit of cAMP-dependent protein kinases [Georgfuchsia toluolica]
MVGVSIAVMQSLPIFGSVPLARLEALARVASLSHASRGGVVLREGENTNAIYFILNGELKVQVSDSEGREVILTMLGRGEMFGEMCAIDDHPRSATVVATQSSDLVVISKQDFQQVLLDNFEVSLAIMRGLANRLRIADRKIESLALLDVYGRVARLLLDSAVESEGRNIIHRPLTKQDIAKMIGASREMVSRVMKDLQQQGLIEEAEDGIVLHDKLDSLAP